MSKILVIIPAYQEEQALPVTIGDLKENAPNVDVVVIDDGSSDSTSQVAQSLGCRVIVLPNNLGIGGAVQTGMMYALENGYDIALQFDADGQHLACEIEKITSPIIDGHIDVAIGSRFLSSGGFKSSIPRRMGIRLFQVVISAAIHRKITDATSGFRAYNRRAIEFLAKDYPCDYPEVEATVILVNNGFALKEIPVLMRERQGGKSSIRPIHSVYYMIKVLLALLMCVLRGPKGARSRKEELAK